ncbi:MAG: helix-turn-helix domain-containing protein [Acidobacteriota bacterium]
MAETLFQGEEKPYFISFSSPKGGVGTTLLSVNFAIQLAKKGNNVLLVDLALNKASTHLFLGMNLPEKNFSILTSSKGTELKNCISSTPVSNLSLIAGMPESLDLANIPYLLKQKILTDLKNLPYEYIIMDCGSGTSNDSLDFALSSDFLVVVVSPNPLAIEPFYRYIRALLHRLLMLSLNKKKYQALKNKIDPFSPLKGLFELEETTESDINDIEKALSEKKLGFVFTKTTEKDVRLGSQIENIIKKFFKIEVPFLGNIDWDQIAEQALLSLEPISKNHPICQYSLSVEKIVNKITKMQEEPIKIVEIKPQKKDFATAYEILEISPNAHPKEIQSAYQRKLEIYSDNSFATIGLMTKEEKEKERDFLEQNYKLLINSQSRQKYDEELISKNIIKEEERISDYKDIQEQPRIFQEAEESYSENGKEGEAKNDISEITYYDGASLRKIRQAMKISVEEIVSETNIRSWYIQSIEEERYDALPARIYLKGFLKQIAMYLKISPEKVLRDYLERYDSWASKKGD